MRARPPSLMGTEPAVRPDVLHSVAAGAHDGDVAELIDFPASRRRARGFERNGSQIDIAGAAE